MIELVVRPVDPDGDRVIDTYGAGLCLTPAPKCPPAPLTVSDIPGSTLGRLAEAEQLARAVPTLDVATLGLPAGSGKVSG